MGEERDDGQRRSRGEREIGARGESEAPGEVSSGIFFGVLPSSSARGKNMEGSKKPYGRGAIAPGATFARARTCSSLVIRLDAIVNLRWLCEKRDSGGRGKPRLVVTGNFQHRETGGSGRKAWIFFSILGTIANSKNVTEKQAAHGFRISLTRKQSDFFRLFR